ncbi:MAG: undecaprenyl/decaprenyl-phosphate alpha-N-acetylglucosaminyl 1-phosphate transferase, partial [Deltaproteobacteria bacterium]|nr:undecaprenyl/decaprenyl-phosphate alpha-N-acetylglucosaminyl 1-phosphate transferase [Deltaproteobacteria bacterium]
MKSFSIYHYVILFSGSFFIALCLTPLVRKLAKATGQMAIPKDSRWHKKETALLGGVSIFISAIGVWCLSVVFMGWNNLGSPYLPVILCATGIFVLGLADDIFTMDPQHKLAAQIVITSIMMMFGFRLGWTVSKTANLFITVIWIVGITNAFNLLDNMDGLSVGIALIAGIFLFLMHYLNPAMSHNVRPILLMSAI